MLVNTKCDKCGDLMNQDIIEREDCLECTQYRCSKCGYCYESGFRYNRLIKQTVKYVKFNL